MKITISKLEEMGIKVSYKKNGEARENATQINCYCPFHDDENYSFSISKENGLWICFTEGISGNFEVLKKKLEELK